MRMKSLPLVLVVLFGFAVTLAAQQGRGPKSDAKGGSRADAHVAFTPHDVALIRSHYEPRDRSLPPGLQKKLARGGSLPPGWEKRLERFPAALERDLAVLPPGHARGVMDGHALIYNPITHAILDIVTLF
jgi:hypothetical protein